MSLSSFPLFSEMYVFDTFVKNQMAVASWVYFWFRNSGYFNRGIKMTWKPKSLQVVSNILYFEMDVGSRGVHFVKKLI
jgi:hypothetical protein